MSVKNHSILFGIIYDMTQLGFELPQDKLKKPGTLLKSALRDGRILFHDLEKLAGK